MDTTKRVLITGAAGFIGSHLCDRFLQEGYGVIGMDNFLTGSPDNISHLLGNANFKFIKYNVTDFIYVAESLDIILHFACPASPIDYLNYPIQTMKVDSIGTLHTLGLARNKHARYILASTSEVYGDPDIHPQTEDYWGNVNPIGPRSVYDEAKRFSEALTMAYHRTHNMDVRIARIFNTYGPRMRMNDGRVIPTFVCQILQNLPVTIFGSGEQTRSFCYISDLVEGIFKLATTDKIAGEVINIGNPDEYTISDTVSLIEKITAKKANIVFKSLPQDDPKRRRPDIQKAMKFLQWTPKVTIQQGLTKTIAYFEKKLAENS